jgi:2'-hydroxyisoflavone reductase
MTELALARGWKVTHFNRGKRDPDGVENVETLNGDRKGQLDSLKGRKWGRRRRQHRLHPEVHEMSADLLAPNTGYCLYISSISAYASFEKPNDIGSPTACSKQDQEEITNETYGPMKALCEQYVRDAYGAAPRRASRLHRGPARPDRPLHVLAGALREGGDMAVPGTPADPDPDCGRARSRRFHDGTRRAARGRHFQRRHAAPARSPWATSWIRAARSRARTRSSRGSTRISSPAR